VKRSEEFNEKGRWETFSGAFFMYLKIVIDMINSIW
jgi:hypothetical protein